MQRLTAKKIENYLKSFDVSIRLRNEIILRIKEKLIELKSSLGAFSYYHLRNLKNFTVKLEFLKNFLFDEYQGKISSKYYFENHINIVLDIMDTISGGSQTYIRAKNDKSKNYIANLSSKTYENCILT